MQVRDQNDQEKTKSFGDESILMMTVEDLFFYPGCNSIITTEIICQSLETEVC